MIKVQEQDFDVAAAYQKLTEDPSAGAVVFFVGLVRDQNLGKAVVGLELEHYPGMTESELQRIVDDAKQRWAINQVELIHRIGKLGLNEQIVFVGVSSKHREEAFEACHFIMDFLKTEAPFWKKELTEDGELWLDAREKDKQARAKWE